MPQIIVEIDAAMARALNRVAPTKHRQRSRFIRLAIQRALLDAQDEETARAYARHPQPLEGPEELDPTTWDEWKPKRSPRKKR